MELEKRLLSELKENALNTRQHNQKQIEEFKKSINKFDVIRPIVIDDDNVILAGHGLFIALRELGRTDADVVVMHGLSDKDKKKLLLADNKIYSLGNDNYSAIENILKELAIDSDFEVPGYDADTLEDLYGIRSVEKEAESGSMSTMQDIPSDVTQKVSDEEIEQVASYTPDTQERVKEARKEAVENRKFVICPNCGEKIWL